MDSMSVSIGVVRTFQDVKPDKAQVLKIGEEYAEVFSAWEDWRSVRETGTLGEADAAKRALIDELADVMQACANMAASLGTYNMQPAMLRCEIRNEQRGRFGRNEEK